MLFCELVLRAGELTGATAPRPKTLILAHRRELLMQADEVMKSMVGGQVQLLSSATSCNGDYHTTTHLVVMMLYR